MGTGNFTDDFKHDAVAQINERGYLVTASEPQCPPVDHARDRKIAEANEGRESA